MVAVTLSGLQRGLRQSLPYKGLRLAAVVLLLALLLPLLAISAAALWGETGEFLTVTTLLYMLGQTLYYVGGVVLLSLLLALPAAWAVVMVDFRGRRLATWLLFLPFALPPYITAYSYDDLLRAGGIYVSGGVLAILTTALALYPYIFFLTRMALKQQHCHIQSAARLLGCSPWAAFVRVSLPLARPAICIGIALTAMETLNDIAVAEYFSVQTLGVGIYDLWLNRGSMIAGARLALLLTVIIFALVWWEEFARRRQVQYLSVCDKCYQCERATKISGGKSALLWLLIALPAVAGFWLPVVYLAYLAQQSWAASLVDSWQLLATGLYGSVLLAVLLVLLLLVAAMLVAMEKRLNKRGSAMRLLVRLSRVIYGLPGTVIAQGIFIVSIAVEFILGWNLLAGGSIALLLFACSTRFYIIAGGTIESGMDKISPQLDVAARLAAVSPLARFGRIYLPLLRSATAATAVMLFLEGIKELPMTLVLRPFNFETLATVIYQYASDEALLLAAPAALLLVALAAGAVTLLFLFEGDDTNNNRQQGQRAETIVNA